MGFFSNLLGTNVAEQAAQSAEEIQRATGEAGDVTQERYGEFGEQVQPYLMGGESAYNQMLAQMGLGGGQAIDPTTTPMFQKPFDFAQERIKEQMSGMGKLYSGETQTALQDRAMSQYYQHYMPMLMGMGQMGQQGAFQYGSAGMNEATNRANMIMRGTETAEGLKVQGEAAKTSALGGLAGSVMGMAGQYFGGGGGLPSFGGGGTPSPAGTGPSFGPMDAGNPLYY